MKKSASMVCGCLMILLAAASLGGCAGKKTEPPQLYSRISVDDLIRRSIIAERPIVEQNVMGNALRVSVPIRSVIPEPLQIQYRFDFLNEEGVPVTSSHGWRYVRIDPRMPISLDASARNSDAVDWRLRIRPAR